MKVYIVWGCSTLCETVAISHVYGATMQSLCLLVQYGDESKLTRLFGHHVNVGATKLPKVGGQCSPLLLIVGGIYPPCSPYSAATDAATYCATREVRVHVSRRTMYVIIILISFNTNKSHVSQNDL